MIDASVMSVLKAKYPLTMDELSIHRKMAENFDRLGIAYEREVVLSDDSRIDFLIGNLGIEVKIKGSKKAIYYQCERYCKFDRISELVLLTNVPMVFDSHILGKPFHIIQMGKAWF